jgi:hypothetical protein
MTASTVYAASLTKILARDGSLNKKIQQPIKVSIEQIEVATTSIDETNDIILMNAIPSNAVILDVKVLCDDLDSHSTPALAVDVGLYYTGIGGTQSLELGKTAGDAIDVDAFASAITSLQAAVVSPTSVRFEAANIDGVAKEAWDVGGLSADPGGFLAIGFKVTTPAATAVAGTLVGIVEYI